jgi:tetratricopeptide (TPR) repeat protein
MLMRGFQVGYCHSELGRYQDSIEACKQAIRIKPDDADAHGFLGATYLTIGNKSSAFEEYKILKTLDAKKADKLFNMINK